MRGALLLAAVWSMTEAQELCHTYDLSTTGDYKVCSTYDSVAAEVTLAFTVKSSGWVGFGIAEPSSGGMAGADIMVVLPNGTLWNMHAVGSLMPLMDCTQGDHWKIQSWSVTNGVATGVVKRAIAAANPNHDRDITPGPSPAIVAYGSSATFGYHMTTRKAVSFTFHTPQASGTTFDFTLEIAMSNFTIPTGKNTVYGCQSFDLSASFPASKSRHAIRIDPNIPKATGYSVHHILVYACKGESASFKNYLGRPSTDGSGSCNMGTECILNLFYGWGVGGGSLVLPDNTGILVGGSAADNLQLLMEVHYDIPSAVGGMVDATSVSFRFTDTLRASNAGMLSFGDPLVMHDQDIQPNVQTDIRWTCPSECTNDINSAGLNVIGVWLHMHQIGQRSFMEQYRNGVKVRTLGYVDYWDLNQQRFVDSPSGVTIEKGDEIRTICKFHHTRPLPVKFGLATSDEMCMGFVLVFPLQNSFGRTCGALDKETLGGNAGIICGARAIMKDSFSNETGPLPARWGTEICSPVLAPESDAASSLTVPFCVSFLILIFLM